MACHIYHMACHIYHMASPLGMSYRTPYVYSFLCFTRSAVLEPNTLKKQTLSRTEERQERKHPQQPPPPDTPHHPPTHPTTHTHQHATIHTNQHTHHLSSRGLCQPEALLWPGPTSGQQLERAQSMAVHTTLPLLSSLNPVSACKCVCACVCVCVSVFVSVRAHFCMHVYICMCMCVCEWVHTQPLHLQ